MESKTPSMNFLYPISVISICQSCALNGPLPRHNSLTACIDHLENTGSLSYADHPDVNSPYTIKTSHSLISPPISSEKSGSMWEAVKLLTADTGFPKFSFLLASSNFVIGNKYLQLFPLK